MKKLLGVVAILVLAAFVLPTFTEAAYRAAFTPITPGSKLVKGHYQPSWRTFPRTGNGTSQTGPFAHRYFAMVTFSSVFGFPGVGQIWQFNATADQISLRVANINEARMPLLIDESSSDPALFTGISYVDPAWDPSGKYLAYVKTDNNQTETSIYIQKFQLDATTTQGGPYCNPAAPVPGCVATPSGLARMIYSTTKDADWGGEFLVVDGTGGKNPHHPAWSPNGLQLVFDSSYDFENNVPRPSIDLYTVDVDPAARTHGTPVRRSFVDTKAEFKGDYSPDGTKLAFVSNLFGPFQIMVMNLSDNTFALAETNAAQITHDNPSWGDNGLSIYYDAAAGEDPSLPQDIWRLDLATQAKCALTPPGAHGSTDADVSPFTNITDEGIHWNSFVMSSNIFASSFGPVNIWTGNSTYNCYPPLSMGIEIKPASINLGSSGNGGTSDTDSTNFNDGKNALGAIMSFPPETEAAGYEACADLSPSLHGKEHIKLRRSFVPSPTMMGVPGRDPHNGPYAGSGIPDWSDDCGANPKTTVNWNRRDITAKLVALGLVDQQVSVPVEAYSSISGRTFKGFGVLNVQSPTLTGRAIVLEQNSPNPFNPRTKISFAVSKPGNVDVRVFNVRGELVRTITNQNYVQGRHTVTWDGTTRSGQRASSGVYYVRANTPGVPPQVIKAVLAE